MYHLWWLTSVFASIVFAMYIFANQIFKLKGSHIMVYRGVGTTLVLLPFCFFIPPVSSAVFYFISVFQGLLIAYLDNRLFNAANRFGAETTSVIQPISVFFGYVIWFIIHPNLFAELLGEPVRFLVITLAILGVVFSVLNLKKNKFSRYALLYLLPAMLSVTVIDILCKVLMTIGKDNLLGAIFYYSLITSFVAGLINLVAFMKGGNSFREVVSFKNIRYAGLPIICIIISMYFLKNYSLFLGTNPAYVMAIIYSYPVWVLLANNLYARYTNKKIYMLPSKKTIFAMVCSIIVLVLAVQN